MTSPFQLAKFSQLLQPVAFPMVSGEQFDRLDRNDPPAEADGIQ